MSHVCNICDMRNVTNVSTRIINITIIMIIRKDVTSVTYDVNVDKCVAKVNNDNVMRSCSLFIIGMI